MESKRNFRKTYGAAGRQQNGGHHFCRDLTLAKETYLYTNDLLLDFPKKALVPLKHVTNWKILLASDTR
jgi:hypothetical protein